MYHGSMRSVTVDDADELASLEMKLFPENCLNEYTLSREIDLGQGFCVTENGLIVAYMLCRGSSYLTDIMRLGVHPDYQRLGLGKQLLRRGLELAEYVMLTVAPANKRALRLYRAHGFEYVGLLKDRSGWVMGAVPNGQYSGRGPHFIGLDR